MKRALAVVSLGLAFGLTTIPAAEAAPRKPRPVVLTVKPKSSYLKTPSTMIYSQTQGGGLRPSVRPHEYQWLDGIYDHNGRLGIIPSVAYR